MKISNYLTKAKLLSAGLLLSGVSVLSAHEGPKPKFIKEGRWRGVFTVSESEVPFNFELKGKDAEHAVFTLINGSRRDNFHVKLIGKDSVYVKMNTYDAALVAKINDDNTITGEYRSLVPGFRGNSLPFTAEYGKTYRFVEPDKNVAPNC